MKQSKKNRKTARKKSTIPSPEHKAVVKKVSKIKLTFQPVMGSDEEME